LALVLIGLLVVALVAVSGGVLVRAFWPAIDGSTSGTGQVSGAGEPGVDGGPGPGGGSGTQAIPPPGTPGDLSAIATAVAPTIVDVNTTLGLQGAQAAGTGIVLTATGVVLTNNHVIAGATGISVTDVGNGRTYPATVVGYDRTEDIAVIQLQSASGLRTAPLGDASTVNAGDAVVALGNAGGVGGAPAAVSGTVTAVNQAITASDESGAHAERLSGLIQVAADIQPGDSGGPLVDAGGKVIGVNTAASAGFRFQASGGQGYAIPINRAAAIANEIRTGHASTTIHLGGTAFLGVNLASAGTTGGNGGGAPVADVVAGSPAEQAGLTRGDTVVAVDGTAVDTASAVTAVLDGHHPGDRVVIGWTDTSGQAHRATVRLAAGPAG
jgi:S1-C subfamily serine protease